MDSQVINIVDPYSDATEAFYSRCSESCYWPTELSQLENPPLLADVSSIATADSKEAKLPIPLHGGARHWQSALPGTVIFSKGVTFAPGALVTAIREGHSHLVLQDPPLDDPEFQSFVFHLQVDGCVYANAEKYLLPPGFQLLQTQSHRDDAPVKMIADDALAAYRERRPSSGQTFFINRQHFHSFFHKVSVTAGDLTNDAQGWITECKSGDLLLLDPELDSGEIQMIMTACSGLGLVIAHCPLTVENRSFHADISQCGAHLIQTTQAEAVISQLLAAHHTATVIPIHQKITYADLIGKITQKKRAPVVVVSPEGEQPLSFEFSAQEHWLLTALIAGETVILKGRLSYELYQALETLFLPEPYLIFNGVRVAIKGRLFIITPELDYQPFLANAMLRYQKTPQKPVDEKATESVQFKTTTPSLLDTPVLCLRGEASQIEIIAQAVATPKSAVFWGETAMDAWIKTKAKTKPVILFIDADQKSDWSDIDIFYGSNRTIYWQGAPTTLSDHHKIIFLANPEDEIPTMPTLEITDLPDAKTTVGAASIGKEHASVQTILDKMSKRMFLPKSRHDFIRGLLCHFANRFDPGSKKGILLEGPSGIGKTTLYRNLLIEQDYKLITPEEIATIVDALKATSGKNPDLLKKCEQRYIHISAGNAEVSVILENAFLLGIPVILDEINLDNSLAPALRHFMFGQTPQRIKPYREGFFVFASQNPVSFLGRDILPQKLERLFHKAGIEDYSRSELMELTQIALQESKIITPANQEQCCAVMVDAYLATHAEDPQNINVRTFLQKLQQCQTIAKETGITTFGGLIHELEKRQSAMLAPTTIAPTLTLIPPVVAAIEKPKELVDPAVLAS